MSTLVLGMIPMVVALSVMFGYLRYRSYVGLVRHISDKHGVDGLHALDQVAGPHAVADAPRYVIAAQEPVSRAPEPL